MDSETGLYYFGARYYDARTSVWQSADPAFIRGEYFPTMPTDQQELAQLQRDAFGYWRQKLPGMGGTYNSMNVSLYVYGGANPVKLVDPDGNQEIPIEAWGWMQHNQRATGKEPGLIIAKAANGNKNAQMVVAESACQAMEEAGDMTSMAGTMMSLTPVGPPAQLAGDLLSNAGATGKYLLTDDPQDLKHAQEKAASTLFGKLTGKVGEVGSDALKNVTGAISGWLGSTFLDKVFKTHDNKTESE